MFPRSQSWYRRCVRRGTKIAFEPRARQRCAGPVRQAGSGLAKLMHLQLHARRHAAHLRAGEGRAAEEGCVYGERTPAGMAEHGGRAVGQM